jgi:hypothetical protein
LARIASRDSLMAKSILRAALIASVATFGASAAVAQFGFIFGDPPPRPPGDVPGGRAAPGGRQPMPAPPQQYPPPPQYPPQQQAYPGPGGGVQTRPLPAPDGRAPVAVAPPPQQQRPPARPPGGLPVPPPPQDEETVAGPPAHRIVHPTAMFSGLDKITGRIINFPVEIGETVQFGALQLTTRACYTRPPTEQANTDAFVEVDEVTLQGEVKRIFTGWMFASSPGLHAVEHPIYDLWLTDCRGGNQVVAADGGATPVEAPPPPAQPKQKAAPKQKQVQQQPKRPPPQQLPPPQQQGYPPFR